MAIATEFVTSKVKEVCDSVLATMPEKDLQELVYKILPNVFVDALYRNIIDSLYDNEVRLQCNAQNMCRSIVDDAFRSRTSY